MLKTIVFFTVFGLSLFFSMFMALIYLVLGVFSKSLQHKFMLLETKAWAKFMIKVTGNKIQINNADLVPEGPVLFVANHQSYFDIPVLMAYLPINAPFIAKVELEKIPMMSFWMRKMGCFFMDRKDIRQSLKVILAGIERLKEGGSLVIFPEGTRAKDGVMMDFKPGSLKLAVKAGVPIVPVTLKNTYKVFEETNRVKKTDVSVTFHEPIDVTALEREEVNVLHNTVRDMIQSTLEG